MTAEELMVKGHHIALHGPTRVIVDADGYGVPAARALRHYQIEPRVVFIRNDGWSLGAPAAYVEIAEAMYRAEWVGVMRLPGIDIQPYPLPPAVVMRCPNCDGLCDRIAFPDCAIWACNACGWEQEPGK